ncbi:MAG: hypothetical protein MUO19_03050 [Dehalococcoidales bacterium]|nr:hypothetical protein [Dehalococcoidales bacterium]
MLKINEPISLEPESIFDRLGYGITDNPSNRIVTLVDDYIDNYNEFISPSCSYIYRPSAGAQGDFVDIGDSLTLESTLLSRMLANCEMVAVFAASIGNYLEDIAGQLYEDGMIVQATVLDAIGSGSVEKIAGILEDTVRDAAAEAGMVISRRFSPGYCDWDVSQQGTLFQSLGDYKAGIELTDNMLMTPRKSVSGIIGIGRPNRGIADYNPCITCKKKDCPGRRR